MMASVGKGVAGMHINRRGQVTAELAVLFTFVIAGLIFMGFYLQRGVQGGVKGNVDALGQQFSTTGTWNSFSDQYSNSTSGNTTSYSCSDYSHAIGTGTADATNCTRSNGAVWPGG
jgi:hypothetical protein